MPENLPTRIDPLGSPTRQELQVVAARREMEGALVSHSLRAHYDKEAARIEAEATTEAVKATLEVEFEVVDWAIEKCEGSATKAKIATDLIEFMSRANSGNLSRRFGA